MPVFTVETPAPRNSNDVYRMRRQGRRLNGLGDGFDSSKWLWDKPEDTAPVIGPSGGAEAHEGDQEATSGAKKFADAMRGISTFITEGAGKDLIDTGMSYYGAREDRKDAETAASIARRQAALAERQSEADIREAQFREQQLRQAALRNQSAAGGSDWIMPAAIAGGAGLLLLLIMKKK